MANKPKGWALATALAAIVLLAVCVCALHWGNAVSLRATVRLDAYQCLEADGITKVSMQPLPTAYEREMLLYTLNGEEAQQALLMLNDPWQDGAVMYLSGALILPEATLGAVNRRVGLMAEEEIILLNTQMVRRQGLLQNVSYDDHCGFMAAVDVGRLPKEKRAYSVVLVDESDAQKRVYMTGMTVECVEGGIAFMRADMPLEEALEHE